MRKVLEEWWLFSFALPWAFKSASHYIIWSIILEVLTSYDSHNISVGPGLLLLRSPMGPMAPYFCASANRQRVHRCRAFPWDLLTCDDAKHYWCPRPTSSFFFSKGILLYIHTLLSWDWIYWPMPRLKRPLSVHTKDKVRPFLLPKKRMDLYYCGNYAHIPMCHYLFFFNFCWSVIACFQWCLQRS